MRNTVQRLVASECTALDRKGRLAMPQQSPEAPARRRLPNRRSSETRALTVGNHAFAATVGFHPADGRPQELFLAGAKDGTDMAAILDDASVVISISLQHGISATALAKSVARLPLAPLTPADLAEAAGPRNTVPASVIGAALDFLCEIEADA